MTSQLTATAGVALGVLASLLAGCSTRTEVSLTGYTPAQYSHVWITTQDVWFNTNGSAGPEDGGWAKYTLKTPTAIDLVALNGGNLASITSGLRLVPGTYSQLRLIPVSSDPSTPLASSAQSAGAQFNAEADYVDSSGVTHQLPLELLNPATGIGIVTSVKVPVGDVSAALKNVSASGTTGLSSSTTTTSTPLGVGSTAGTTRSASAASATSSNAQVNSFVVSVNGTTDLVPFNYAASNSGVMLSSHAAAYDVARCGGISGTLTLSNITTATSGLPAIQVNAETLSADGTRHVVVSTTSLQSDGSFLLYPLATDSRGVDYDVVIHGPGIATIIIKAVQVTLASSTTSATTPASTTTTATTSSTTTANNVVAIGTLTPRAATSFTANLSTPPAAGLPAGAQLQFYETIKRTGEVPYVIESSAIDPFNQVLFNDQPLSADTIDSGSWSASGGAVTVVSAAPAEGAGNYRVAATAPSYNDGAFVSISAPTAGTPTTVRFVAPGLSLASGTVAGTLTAAVISTGSDDRGQLLVSHDGTLVAAASLQPALTGAGSIISVTGLPAGTPSALYYLSVLAWNHSTPAAVHRQWYPIAIDLRGSAISVVQLTVN
jgi:hypothetical protein